MNKKATKKKRGRPETGHVRFPGVRLTPDQLSRYTEAAASAGVAFSEWVREALDKAAHRK